MFDDKTYIRIFGFMSFHGFHFKHWWNSLHLSTSSIIGCFSKGLFHALLKYGAYKRLTQWCLQIFFSKDLTTHVRFYSLGNVVVRNSLAFVIEGTHKANMHELSLTVQCCCKKFLYARDRRKANLHYISFMAQCILWQCSHTSSKANRH